MTPASPSLPRCPPPSRPQALLSLCSWELPQQLGVEEHRCQEEGEEAEAQPGPGEQSHLLLRSRSRLLLPLPQQDGTAANCQGHLTKDISSRAERQHQLPTRPETSTPRFLVGFY